MDSASQSRIQTVCAMILASAVVGYSIYWLRPILVPFVISVFVVSGVAPILESLQRRLGVNRLVAAGITFIAGLFALILLGWILWSSVVELQKVAPAYRQRVQASIAALEKILATSDVDPSLQDATSSESPRQIGGFLDSLLTEGITALSSALLNLATNSIVVLIYIFFLLLGETSQFDGSETWRKIDRQIRVYLRLKTIISLLTGLAFGAAIALFGAPMAMTFGLLAFLLNFIPNIGPLAATLLPIPLIVFHPDATLVWMASAITVTSAIQFISGNVVEPKIMGDSTELHPVVVLLALVFWGMLWGIVGMFLATPITAMLRIILERSEATKPIANVLSGKSFPRTGG